MKPKGRRKGMRSLELFAGAGGSLLGYEIAGFDTVMAVETDKDAVRTLQENNKGLKVYHGCIKKFMEQFGVLKCALGKTDHRALVDLFPSIRRVDVTDHFDFSAYPPPIPPPAK